MISRRNTSNNVGAPAPAVNISNPMSRVPNKGRPKPVEVAVCQRVAIAAAMAIVFLYFNTSDNTGFVDSEQTTAFHTNDVASRRRAFEDGTPVKQTRAQSINSKIRSQLETSKGRKQKGRRQKQGGHQSPSPGDESAQQRLSVRSSTTDQVLRYLLEYARQTPGDLWDTLGVTASGDAGNSFGADLFSLKELEDGTCPWKIDTQVEWLPDVPFKSDEIAAEYRFRMDALGSGLTRRQMKELDDQRKVLIWYEHISKGEWRKWTWIEEWQVEAAGFTCTVALQPVGLHFAALLRQTCRAGWYQAIIVCRKRGI
mmetsp:Transcript_10087/g.22998  ORF Transcript_10087/g.22998 Transcript_10087/m.22998 type:complete len:312 (+) Transcript_10087:267-1202(+)